MEELDDKLEAFDENDVLAYTLLLMLLPEHVAFDENKVPYKINQKLV